MAGSLRRLVNEPLRDSVRKGDCPVSSAAVVMQEMDRMRPRLRPEAIPTVMAGLVHLAGAGHPSDVRRLRPQLLADYGAPGELQADQDTAWSCMCDAQATLPRASAPSGGPQPGWPCSG